MLNNFRRWVAVLLAELILCSPIATLLPAILPVVHAASTAQLNCPTAPSTVVEDNTPVDPVLAAQNIDTDPHLTDDEIGNPSTAYISATSVANAPGSTGIISELNSVGIPSTDGKGWTICSALYNSYLQSFRINTQTGNFLQLLTDSIGNSPKISFKNPEDQWALTGEPCRKYLSDGTCDETKGKTGLPLYYDDIYWSNGHWDAPKADSRILQALVYLVTPTSEGGAGHEYVQVSKIIQDSKKDKDFTNANQTPDQQAIDDQGVSAHYYDHDNPEHPTQIAQSMELSQIDQIRVTTRITEKHRVGGDSKTYQYKNFPINVAWQSDEGIAQSPLPQMTNIYSGALQSVTGSFGQLLDSLDLQAELDPSKNSVTSLGDLTKYVGDSLLTSLLQGGSLQGFDLSSTLDNFGRSYLAAQLKLPKNALSRGDTVQELVQNVGQSIAEQNLGLPTGSLDGTTSDQIYRSMGARYYENIFKVVAGTLSSSPINNQDQLLQALGRGKLEKKYELKPGSLAKITSTDQLLALNYKTKSLFNDQYSNLVDDDLALTFAPSPTVRKYGLSESSFNNPTNRLIKHQLELNTYELLVGIRVWDTSIGQFTPSITQPEATPTNKDCKVAAVGDDVGSCLSAVSGSSFAPYLLQNFGVDLSLFAPGLATAPFTPFTKDSPVKKDSRPNPDKIVQQAIASPQAQQLITAKALTAPQLTTLVQTSVSILYGATASNPATTNNAPAQLELDSGLKTLINAGLTPLTTQAGFAQSDDKFLPLDTATSATNFLTTSKSMLDTDMNKWTTVLTEQNQSGQSAALDLPGSIPQFNASGIIAGAPPLLSQDPVTQLWNGDLSALSVIGKLELAKKLSGDKLSQYSLASQLTTDLSPSFGNITNALSPVIDNSKLQGFGLKGDDFSKIFQKNLSAEVFQRVGQDALLGSVWNVSGAGAKTNAAISGSTELKQAVSLVSTGVNDISFYTNHWKELQKAVKQLAELPGTTSDDVRNQLRQIANSTQGEGTGITNQSSNLETLLHQFNAQTDTARNLAAQATLLINEIIAGHDLSFTQPVGSSITSNSATSCWSQQLMRGYLANSKTNVQELTVGVGSCQLESSLNLPTGSIFNFYQGIKNGAKLDLEGFAASVGRADYGSGTYPSYSDAVTRGTQVLERKGVASLLQTIPGVSGTLGKLGLTADSLFGLIQGQSEKIKITLGGQTLDTKLQLPGGTMQQVVQPECGAPPCTQEQAKDSRATSLAKAGMKKLSLALDLPAGLDITGKGNFATNYGKAYLSQNLALATNSFDGPFSQVLSKNTPQALLSTFGLGDTVYDLNLLSIQANLRQAYTKYASDSGTISSLGAMIGEIDNQVLDSQNKLIVAMQDGNSMLYYPDPTPASYQTFAAPFTKGYADTLATLNSEASGLDVIQQIIKPYLDELARQPEQNVTQVVNQIGAYQRRLSSLDATYALQGGTFAKYILGQVDATAINQAVGQQRGEGKLTDDAITKILAKNNNPLIQEVVTGLKDFTKTATCPDGMSVGQLLISSGSLSGCQSSSLAHIDLSQLLAGTDPASKQQRSFLYDSLLGRTFGASLETTMHLPTGTIRNFALNPRQAPEIALTIGLKQISDQLFQITSKDDYFKAEAKDVLKNAFLAGFYDVTTNQYGYDFNQQRSLVPLKTSLLHMEQQELSVYSKQYLGTTISISDLQDIASGDPTGLLYVGLQRFAFGANQALDKLAIGDPRAAAFKINYADIRNAIAFNPTTTEESGAAYYRGAMTQLEGDYLTNNINCASLCDQLSTIETNGVQTNQKLLETIQTDPNYYAEAYGTDMAGLASRDANIATLKKTAQQNLQYRMYDIAAYQIDKNIPVGFSKAMLSGNSAVHANLISQYAFNALKLGDSSLGPFLNARQVGGLVQYAASNFKDTSSITQAALDGLDGWSTAQFHKQFGIELPFGTMAGIIGWASTGFSSSQFSSAKITQGPLACPPNTPCKFNTIKPIGTILISWGTEKLFAWGDKVLGFNAGGTYQIYTAASTYIKAAQALVAANAALQAANIALDFANTSGGLVDIAAAKGAAIVAKDAAGAAHSASVAGEAALISTVINIVFAKQIGQAETQLGLVPGTGSLAVSMLVTGLLGGPLDLITLALFIGMNLFGVYKTVVDTSATADGYYPYKGAFGSTGLADGDNADSFQVASSNYKIGEFNPRDDTGYHNGVKQAAQAKIQSVLADLLLFPAKWGAAQGIDPIKLYISQVFTLRQEDLQQLDYLISQPSPRDNPAGLGYGPLAERSQNIRYDDTAKQWLAEPNGQRFGYFFSPLFSNQVHVRW